MIGHCHGVGTEVKGQQEEGGDEDKLKTFLLFFFFFFSLATIGNAAFRGQVFNLTLLRKEEAVCCGGAGYRYRRVEGTDGLLPQMK